MENAIIYQTLMDDLDTAGEHMQAFAQQVIQRRISRYPVYIASQDPVSLGKPFLDRDALELAWNYNVSVFEDLLNKGIIAADKAEDFREAYGNAMERACIFVITDDGGSFVFVPYRTDTAAAD